MRQTHAGRHQMRLRGFFTAVSIAVMVVISAALPITGERRQEQGVVVTSTADSGDGSLRQAMDRAAPGTIITFDPAIFPPDDAALISITMPLPAVDKGGVTIDASNTGVILDGSELAREETSPGIIIESSGNIIRGLQILSFPGDGVVIERGAQNNVIGGNRQLGEGPTGQGNVISLNGAVGLSIINPGTSNNVVIGNYIGTDPSGYSAWGNGVHGVMIQRANSNTIGGAAPGEGNVISGNQMAGVRIEYPESTGNVVIGNYIGTDASGVASLGGNFHGGVAIDWGASENRIGGLAEGERNIISGNIDNGVYIGDSGTMYNTVLGNWIGLYLDEARQAFPSDLAISPDYGNDCTLYVATLSTGLHKSVDCGDSWFEVNNDVTESRLRQIEIPAAAGDANTVFGLTESGHLLVSTDGAANWSLVSTSLESIDLRNIALSPGFVDDQTVYASAEGWSSEELGGGPGVFKSTDGGATWRRMVNGMSDDHVWKVVASPDPAAKEILVALTHSGIEMSSDGGENWAMITSPDPDLMDLALSPTFASDQTIFVTTYTARVFFSNDGGRNWIGVDALCDNPSFVALSPDFVHDGKVCYLAKEGANRIYCSSDGGGTWAENDMLQLGHLETGGTGIAFSPNYASDATIFVIGIAGMARSNDGGTTWEMVRGLRDMGNVHGVSISHGASDNTIGPQNVISNNHDGVVIDGADTANNVIIGNLIGTDSTGTIAQANSCEGVSVRGGHHNLIGGRRDGDRNILSGNMCAGLWLGFPDTMSNTAIGNYIGTDMGGLAPLGNGGEGGVVVINGTQNNVIGSDAEGERNVISGNERDGVFMAGSGTMSNTVSGNFIGVDGSGLNPLGNSGVGVSVNWGAVKNNIGPGNLIAYNASTGVRISGDTATGNRITQNSIYDNGESGIEDLGGGNTELTAPTITFVGTRLIRGTAPPNVSVEIFSDNDEEAEIYEGSTTADNEGNFAFSVPAGTLTGPNVTANATDTEGNTSQFSPPQSPPAPEVTRELPGIVAPTQVSLEPTVVGTNLGLALFSVFFFGLTSTVFNSILVDYHDELTRAFKRLIPRRFADSVDRTGPALHSLAKEGRGRLLLMWFIVLLGVSVIESFLDPEPGVLSPERLRIFITIFVSAIVVSGLELGADLFAHRRWAPAARHESKIQWVGIAIAVACVILSRAVEFRPGYLYGIVGAIYLLPKLTDTTKSGKRATFTLMTVFLGGLVLWIATAFLPNSLAELEPIFLTIFLISVQGVFFELFPLAITEGGDIWNWRRGAWLAFFSIVFFCFYHFLLNPNASDVQALQQNGVQTLLSLMAVFGLATLVLWLLLPFRLRRKRASRS